MENINIVPRMDDSLLCRLMNVRIIGSGRLPKEEIQTINDAIEAMNASELVKVEGATYAVPSAVASELSYLRMALTETKSRDISAEIASRPVDRAVRPCAWACTDYDGRVGVGITKEDAKTNAGENCEHFFGLVAGPELAQRLTTLADELDAELDSGAKWTKAQHTCESVSAALREMVRDMKPSTAKTA